MAQCRVCKKAKRTQYRQVQLITDQWEGQETALKNYSMLNTVGLIKHGLLYEQCEININILIH